MKFHTWSLLAVITTMTAPADMAASLPAIATSLPAMAAPAAGHAPPDGPHPPALALRFAAQGWVGFLQTGAAALTCAAPRAQPLCANDGAPASWIDVDADVSTVNSNTAFVTLPPGSSVDWAGLYWAGSRGGGETGPGCAGARHVGGPVVLPPDPRHANQVKVAVDGGGYVSLSAEVFIDVAAPNGAPGFQAQADITGMVRPLASPARAVRVALTVADLQVAHGVGCAGGWIVTIAYSYRDGPNRTYAPQYRSLAVADGAIALPAGTAQQIRVDALALPRDDPPDARAGFALLASDPSVDSVIAGGKPLVATPGAVAGEPSTAGYRIWATDLPAAAIQNTSATFGVTSTQDAFLFAVVVLTDRMAVRVDLAVTTSVVPDAVPIGDDTTVTVAVRNDSPVPATGVRVTARLPAGLILGAAAPGYDARTGVWLVGSVAAHASVAITMRVRVERTGTLIGTAEVSAADLPDVDSTPSDQAANEDDLALLRLSGQAPVSLPRPSPAADVAVSAPGVRSAGLWPQLRSSLLIGTGLFLLGLVMALIIVLRRRVDR